MAEARNETDEGVEFSHEEGEGTGKIRLFKHLGPRCSEELKISAKKFSIYFYEIGCREKPVAYSWNIPADSIVRLHKNAEGSWAVDVSSDRVAIAS